MIENIQISGVCERDIDLLLLEELVSNFEFLEWFASKVVDYDFVISKLIAIERSVTQSNGESDLEIVLEATSSERLVILIENKVNANLQPLQAQRYVERGNTYLTNNRGSAFITVIIAPERYFSDLSDQKGFDKRVTYEDLKFWFENNTEIGLRRLYKLALITAAIQKGQFGYQAIADAPVTDFWQKYWKAVQELAPELNMPFPHSKPPGAGFIYFKPVELPLNIKIVHKTFKGYVDLQFAGMKDGIGQLREQFQDFASKEMKYERASGSGSIRLYVAEINPAIDFDEQLENVTKAIEAAKDLFQMYLQATRP